MEREKRRKQFETDVKNVQYKMVEQSKSFRNIRSITDHKNEIYSTLIIILYTIYTTEESDSKTSSKAKAHLTLARNLRQLPNLYQEKRCI